MYLVNKNSWKYDSSAFLVASHCDKRVVKEWETQKGKEHGERMAFLHVVRIKWEIAGGAKDFIQWKNVQMNYSIMLARQRVSPKSLSLWIACECLASGRDFGLFVLQGPSPNPIPSPKAHSTSVVRGTSSHFKTGCFWDVCLLPFCWCMTLGKSHNCFDPKVCICT